MKKLLLLTFSLFCLLACQEAYKESTKEKQAPKDTLKNKVARKKVTFEDIKGRFLHRNPEIVTSKEKKFYDMVAFPKDTCKNLITIEELEDLGLHNYKHQRNRYFAYCLHEWDECYWLGLAYGGEYMTTIIFFRLDKQGRNPQFLFELRSEADGGKGRKDFAVFYKNYIEVHLLSIYVDALEYKKYQIKWLADKKMKIDTLINTKQQDKEWNMFIDILKKHQLEL